MFTLQLLLPVLTEILIYSGDLEECSAQGHPHAEDEHAVQLCAEMLNESTIHESLDRSILLFS